MIRTINMFKYQTILWTVLNAYMLFTLLLNQYITTAVIAISVIVFTAFATCFIFDERNSRIKPRTLQEELNKNPFIKNIKNLDVDEIRNLEKRINYIITAWLLLVPSLITIFTSFKVNAGQLEAENIYMLVFLSSVIMSGLITDYDNSIRD